MKRFYTLLSLEFAVLFAPLCVLIGVMAVLEAVLFGFALWHVDSTAPLAYLIDSSGIPIIFGLTFGLLLIFLNLSNTYNYTPSKSIYALLTLPVKRSRIYNAKLLAALLAGFCVIAAQLALLLIALAAYTHLPVPDLLSGRSRPSAVLFLTLLNSRFLRLLVPPDAYSFAFSLTILFGAVCLELSVSAQARAGRKVWVIAPVALWLLLVIVTFPLTDKNHWQNMLTLSALILIPLSMSLMGAAVFKSGEVAA